MSYYLYILRSQQKETYYIGCSENPERRCHFHNNDSKKGHTLRYRPWKIVYTHEFNAIEEALKAEKIVKNWKSKKMTRYLIEGKVDIIDYV